MPLTQSRPGLALLPKLLPFLMLFVLAWVWGSSFILMKKGLVVYSSTQVAAMRLCFAGGSLLPLALPRLRQVRTRDFRYLLLVALIGNGLPAFLFTWAQTHLSSSLTGALNSLVPLFALLIGVLVFRQRPVRQQQAGVGLGLAGAILLVVWGSGRFLEGENVYGLLVVLATLCYATSATLVKQCLGNYPSLTITSVSLGSLVLPALLYLAWVEPLAVPSTAAQWTGLGAVFTLGFVGSALALLIFYHLIGMTSALFATSVTYLMPVVALFWGWLDGEQLAPAQLAGMGAVLLGVYLINRHRAA
jgi:drug/metabolite transporter (DMT)-like permease